MSFKLLACTSIAIVFTLLLPLSAICGDEPGRLPPTVQKYPGRGGAEETSYDKHVNYTKDRANKVVDFYRNSLGMEPVGKGKFLVGEDIEKLDRSSHFDSTVWLDVYSAADNKRNTLDDGDLFELLHQEVVVKRTHSEQELEQVKQKYAHLKKAWYPDIDPKKKLKSCSASARSGVTAARNKEPRRNKQQEKDMVAQMQQLMAQGRHQEAAALAQQSARPGMDTSKAMQQDHATDHWQAGITCLDELDEQAYPTKIEMGLYINRHFKPSTKAQRKTAAENETAQTSKRQAREQKRAAEKQDAPANVSEQMNKFKKMFKF